jgi:hypothetical protein
VKPIFSYTGPGGENILLEQDNDDIFLTVQERGLSSLNLQHGVKTSVILPREQLTKLAIAIMEYTGSDA